MVGKSRVWIPCLVLLKQVVMGIQRNLYSGDTLGTKPRVPLMRVGLQQTKYIFLPFCLGISCSLFQAPSQCIKKSWLTYLCKILCLDPTSAVHRFKWDSPCFESCLIVTSGHLNLYFLWLVTFWVLGCPLDGGLTWVLGPIKSVPFPWVEVFLQ